MARPKKKTEDNMVATQEISTTKSYGDLFGKIESLQGKEKQKFTKTLTMDEKKAYVNHLKEKDCERVSGIFRSFEPLGGMLEMTAMAYDGESPTKYTFYDGVEYTVPRYIARRFENEFQGVGTWYPTHSHILDSSGQPTISVGKKNRRFAFSSLDFQ